MTIRFDGKVAIVTGAGGGLGRAYALELARRGARVVVNDLGCGRDGTGQSDSAAAVADEIRQFGGDAIADCGDVGSHKDMERMVASAMEAWGGVHILINNAGNLRDKSFVNMSPADFESVIRVHLLGAAYATKAAWPVMRTQGFGRVLMITSAAGLGGNFGQANYAAGKSGVIGLARTLSLEGAKYGIRVNLLTPTAGTRLTEDIYPQEAFGSFSIEDVVPAALFLVSDDAPMNAILGAGGGVYQSAWITMNRGVLLPEDERTPEGIAAAWKRIADRSHDAPVNSGIEQAHDALKALKARSDT